MGSICKKYLKNDNEEEKKNENDIRNEDIKNKEKIKEPRADNKNNKDFTEKQTNEVDIKKKTNNVIYEIIANIEHNTEYDETKELYLDYLEVYINSIFPENFPINYIEDIKSKINEIKYLKIGDENKIQNLFEFHNLNNKQSFYFICSLKKISENTINIAYKFKIIDINIQTINISKNASNELVENVDKENQKLINNAINKEFQKLNKMI